MKKIILILIIICVCGLFTGCFNNSLSGILDSVAGAINESELFNTLVENND